MSVSYTLKWAKANILGNPWVSITSLGVVAVAAMLALSLLAFVEGYQQSAKEDIDQLGYDLLITAKGCPYEAATLMLRGGVGLQYMPSGVVERLKGEPGVNTLFPMLIHPVKSPGDENGITLLKGVEEGWFEALKLGMKEGHWFSASNGKLTPSQGVVLGIEAAELETRHAGDPYLLYNPKTREFRETKVLGVLEQTGTQVDGTVLLPLREVQDGYDLAGKLTGVGVQLHDLSQEEEDLLRDRYNLEPELQVVTLSKVESTLRKATDSMREMIQVLAWFLGLITGAVLLNTTLLRTLGQRRKLLSLRLSGISIWFIGGVAIAESLLLAVAGLGVGVVLAWLLQVPSGEFLAQYLPYVPSGQLVRLSPQLVLGVMGIGSALAILATLPPLVWISKTTHPNSLREG